MKVLQVELSGLWQSFRLPLTFTYQRTLLFPPPSTLYGLIGCCLGRNIIETHIGLPREGVTVGAVSRNGGQLRITRDLMTYYQYKGHIPKQTVIDREIVAQLFLTLFVSGADNFLHELAERMIEPVGAMVLGHADELVTARECQLVELTRPDDKAVWFSGLYQGDIRPHLQFDSAKGGRWQAPKSFSLPLTFEYHDDAGLRTVAAEKFQLFTQLENVWSAKPDVTQLENIWMHPNEHFLVQLVKLDGIDSRQSTGQKKKRAKR